MRSIGNFKRTDYSDRMETGAEMENNGLQRIWIRILLTVLTVALMVQIFCFSMETAERSDATSRKYAEQVISLLHPDYERYPEDQQQVLLNEVQHVVRKLAHFTEYAALGLLMTLCLMSWFGRRQRTGFAAWAGGTFYACTDELHQLLTDGRSGQWTDVLIDSSGVLTGVLLVSLVIHLIRLRKKRKETEKACP